MKWIGQHIIDLIARFRSDVYLEDIDTGTIASGGNLGLDSDNKIVKAAESSGGISHDGSTANGVLTFKDADEATVEANLTFNGSSLNINGSAEIDSDGKLYFRDGYSFIQSPSANDLLIASIADCEIASNTIVLDAGASIELDAVSSMALKVGDDEFLDFKNVNNTFARFHAESGANTSFTLYEQGGDSLVDYCTLTVGEHGATTISTIDQAAAQAHFEIATDGHITLDATGKINLEIEDGEYIDMYNTTNKFASFYAESGSNSSLTMWEMGGDSSADYFQLYVTEHGATKLTTTDGAAAAAHLELEADGDITLDAAGQIKLEPGTSVLWDNVDLTSIQASSESFSNDDVSLMTSAAIDDKINTKYSTSYITFSVKTNATHGTNYILMHPNGISGGLVSVNSSVDSATDFGGVTAEEAGDSTEQCSIATASLEQQIPIPETCKLMGFYATATTTTGSGGGDASVDMGVAIWHMPEANVNWGSHVAGTATLIHKSDSSRDDMNGEGTNRKKVQKIVRMDGTAKNLAAGDIIIPSVFGETADQQITATITLVIATPIKTIA